MPKFNKLDYEIIMDLLSNTSMTIKRSKLLLSKKKKSKKSANDPVLYIKDVDQKVTLLDALQTVTNNSQLTILGHGLKNLDFIAIANGEKLHYQELAQFIKNNIPTHVKKLKINLIVCEAANGDFYTKSFAFKLQTALYNEGINSEITARTEAIAIVSGKKYTLKEGKTQEDLASWNQLRHDKKITSDEFRKALYDHHRPGSKVISYINDKRHYIHVHDAYLDKIFKKAIFILDEAISYTKKEKLKNGLSSFRDEIIAIIENTDNPELDLKKLNLLIQQTEQAINNNAYHFSSRYSNDSYFWSKKKFSDVILQFLYEMKTIKHLYDTQTNKYQAEGRYLIDIDEDNNISQKHK